MRTEAEVAIVGAGPVGLLLACLLAQQGVSVNVFERRSEQAGSARAIGIHPPGLQALETAGVAEEIQHSALQLLGGSALCRGTTLATLHFTSAGPSNRTVLTLPQTRTEQILRARLETLQPGALRAGHLISALTHQADGVSFTVTTAETQYAQRAEYLVAADGVHSPIRRALNIGWTPLPGRADYLMMDVPSQDAAHPWAELHCEPEGIVECFPLPQGQQRWVVFVPPADTGHETAAETAGEIAGAEAPSAIGNAITEAVLRRTARQVEYRDASLISRFTARQHLAERLVQGRVVLLGDAAHEISPIGGQGMNLGWFGAKQLATAFAELRGGSADALLRYEQDTRRRARRTQQRARQYMALGAPVTGIALGARNLLIRSGGSPLTRSWLAGRLTMAGI